MSATGPIEEQPWPTQLDAHVVTPGPRPRVHGYDVEGELCLSGSVTELALLATTGELPSKASLGAAEIALQFAAAVSIAEASVHAAMLGRLAGASASGLVAIAATGLAEQAREAIDALGDWPTRLADDPDASPPLSAKARDQDDRDAAQRLASAVASKGLVVPALEGDLSRFAAIVAVLVACGARGTIALLGLLVAARLPTTIAEAASVQIAEFRKYPMNTPRFVYEAER